MILHAHNARSTALTAFAIISAAALTGCHPGARPRQPIRAIWVTRWDYKTPADISRVMDNCRTAGFNTVLFQVRGSGTVFYRSKIEPWADELGGRDPGFDPLRVACREAHRRGMSLHAWVNVMPGWRGNKPPANRRQLYHAHADWFWRDAAGRRQPLGWYNSLNPCYPEVRKYIVQVCREIIANYPVDGLHLDYVRFPNEWHESYASIGQVPDYPRDPRTLALFKRATGHTPESAPHLWNGWRTANVTQLVRDIRAMMHRVKPDAQLSAAVGVLPDEARNLHFQDSRRWVAEGLVDAVYPMNYSQDPATFGRGLQVWSQMRLPIPVVVGIMADKRESTTVAEQIYRTARATRNFAVFAYNSLFERFDRAGRPVMDTQSGSRAALRGRVIPHVRRLAATRA
jgi:uncharacterized lipoprotein YddW (UPF0748 family)